MGRKSATTSASASIEHNKKPPPAFHGHAAVETHAPIGNGARATLSIRLSEETQARCGDRTGLAVHRAAKLLALKRGGEVHFAAGEQAGQKFHDTSPCIEVTRGAFA